MLDQFLVAHHLSVYESSPAVEDQKLLENTQDVTKFVKYCFHIHVTIFKKWFSDNEAIDIIVYPTSFNHMEPRQ